MKYKIAVRQLVEFVLKDGDLDISFTIKNRALEGTKAHQVVQGKYDDNTESEVFVSKNFIIDNYEISVSGRIDGLIKDDIVIVDEIKSTTRNLFDIEIDDNRIHWAQAMFYAYIYMTDNNLNSIICQLTYVEIENYECIYFKKEFDKTELEEFVFEILNEYIKWIKLQEKNKNNRNKTIDDLRFPFGEYRKYQREIAVVTYQAMRDEKNTFIQAATGIGKTMATIFPSIKGLKSLDTDKIFYLTAKTITRTVAENSLQILIDNGLNIRAITLTAKEKICFYEATDCNIEKCKYMKGYYSKVKDAIKEVLNTRFLVNREAVEEIAKKYGICPFEFSLDLSMFCDIIIGDYNYAFDPRVKLKRYFEDSNFKISLLVDESHNLVNRARSMYSAELYKQDFLDMKKLVKNRHKLLSKKIEKVNKAFLKLKHELNGDKYKVNEEYSDDLYERINELNFYLEGFLRDYKKDENYEEILEFYFNTFAYARISELNFDGSVFYFEKLEKNNYKAKLFNIDPSFHLSNIKRHSCTFFSATLSPIKYYREILGGKEEESVYMFPSPFNKENQKVLFSNEISTRYKDRTKSIDLICEYIKKYISNNKGNNIVFFPSYEYMQNIKERYEELFGYDILIQSRNMSEEDREEFIYEFEKGNSLTAFVVLGGIFSEGIDLKGDKLIGVILVGIGLPGFGLENNIIKEYYEKEISKGFEYAYSYPAIIKIMQAVGRVIRTKKDKGTILLLGDRFSSKYYRKMLPNDWGNEIVTLNNLEKKLNEFWKTSCN